MTAKKHSVRVTIVGEEYSLRSDAAPEHTRAVAAHVDEAIRTITNSGSIVIEAQKAAILAALQITDELFRARESNALLAERIEALSAEVRRWLPPAKRASAGGADEDGGVAGAAD